MYIEEREVTIPNGVSISNSVEVGYNNVLGIILPSGLLGSSITFSVSQDNDTFYDLYDITSAEFTISPVIGKQIILDPIDSLGYLYLKVRTGTSGTPVVQTADKTIKLIIGQI